MVKYYPAYGWKPSLPDHRDFKLLAAAPETLPETIDLRKQIDWLYNQQKENSCTAQCCASMARFLWKKDKNQILTPSRNFIYWNERFAEPVKKKDGTIGNCTNSDGGAYLRDGVDSLQGIGVCFEDTWDYNNQTLFAAPPQSCFDVAKSFRIQTYYAVEQTRVALQTSLAQGYPLVFGMVVVTSFESGEVARTGIVPMPTSQDKPKGGHAILMVGYDNPSQYYLCMNSWGPNWGDRGYFYLPYEFVESNLCDDFFTARGQQVGRIYVSPPQLLDLGGRFSNDENIISMA